MQLIMDITAILVLSGSALYLIYYIISFIDLFWGKYTFDSDFIFKLTRNDLPLKISQIKKVYIEKCIYSEKDRSLGDYLDYGEKYYNIYVKLKNYSIPVCLFKKIPDTEKNRQKIDEFFDEMKEKKETVEKMNELFKRIKN